MSQLPVPVFPGKFTGAMNAGSVSFVLQNGEVCQGRWTRVVPVKNPQGGQSVAPPPAADMPAIWDQIYGAGFYVSHVLGTTWHGQAVVTGSQGTVLTVEFYRPDAIPQVQGVAKDNKGDVYKLAFNLARVPQ